MENYNFTDLSEELKVNFIEYANEVNTNRAIPDAKSGLKPVTRRILWDMYDTSVSSDKPHKKCARIVGSVMGKWHPHGRIELPCINCGIKLEGFKMLTRTEG